MTNLGRRVARPPLRAPDPPPAHPATHEAGPRKPRV